MKRSRERTQTWRRDWKERQRGRRGDVEKREGWRGDSEIELKSEQVR